MQRSSPLTLGMLLVVVLMLCGCDSSSSPDSHGAEIPAEFPRRPWGTPLNLYYANLDLPVVENPRWDRATERKVVVNLLRSGDVRLGNHEWPLVMATASERRAQLEELGSEMRRHCAADGSEDLTGGCPVPVLLQADRWASWEEARDVLRCALEERVHARRLQFAVRSPATRRDVVLEASATPLPSGSSFPEEGGLTLELSGRTVHDEEVEIRVSVAAQEWFASYPKYAREEFRDASIRALEAAEPSLAALGPGDRRALLRLPEGGSEVRWGHVVKLVDMALGPGIRTLDVPQLRVSLSLAEPQEVIEDPFVHADDPVITPLTLALCILASAAAFAVTLAPLLGLRSGRSRRQRA